MADSQTITIDIPGVGTLTIPATFAPVMTPDPAPTPTPKLAIGTNVPANDPLQGVSAWCDVTRQMTGWYGINSQIKYDVNGYPAVVTGANPAAACWTYLYAYPSGTYKLAWKGPQNGLSVAGKNIASLASDGAGGWTGTVQFNTTERVEFRSIGGISAVSLLSPDAKPGQTFRDAYLALLKPYKVIRLMPMQRVNGIGLPPVVKTDWGRRVTQAMWDWTSQEVPAEVLAKLCLEADCIPWVCIPYGASDDWIKGVANVFTVFSTVYFEHGNEYWNTGPAYQGNQIRADGVKAGLSADPNVAGAKLHAQITQHLAALVKPIIPKAKIVLGAQATWEAWAKDALASLPAGVVDCLAVAPYFVPADGMPVDTVANVAAACQTWIDTTLAQGLAKNAAVAKNYGCETVGYEGGQSLIPNGANAPPVELQWQADISQTQYNAYRADPTRAIQDDPAIGQLYDNLFKTCLASGLTLLCHFMVVSNFGRSGFWGARQQTTDPENPKTQALSRAIAAGN